MSSDAACTLYVYVCMWRQGAGVAERKRKAIFRDKKQGWMQLPAGMETNKSIVGIGS